MRRADDLSRLLPLPSLAYPSFSARERSHHVFLRTPLVERGRQPLLRRQRVSLFPSRSRRCPETFLPSRNRAHIPANSISMGGSRRRACFHWPRELCRGLGLSARPALLRDDHRRHLRRISHPCLFHRLHGPRRRLLQILRLSQSLHVLHAHARPRQQSFAPVRRLGRRWPLQLLAHRLLFPEKVRSRCRQESLHRQPHWRRGISPRPLACRGNFRHRPVHIARSCRSRRFLGHFANARQHDLATPVHLRRASFHRHRSASFHRRCWKIGSNPALRLAARRDGGSNTRQRIHPRRHRGRRWRLHGRSHERHLSARPCCHGRRLHHRRHHGRSEEHT